MLKVDSILETVLDDEIYLYEGDEIKTLVVAKFVIMLLSKSFGLKYEQFFCSYRLSYLIDKLR
jgi:hypothetical protein